jgi:penicillin-binding protein 1C
MTVTDAASSWLIADILADRLARSLTFGLDSPLAARHWAAVKTGTSKDMRDNWCIGFTERYTVGVWVGNFDGSPMHDVSGVTGAAPIWLEIINFLHRSRPSRAPRMPATLVAANLSFEHDIEPPRDEFFFRGTELRRVSAKAVAATRVSIAYPGEGTIIALDPDIPQEVQQVRFLARPEPPGYRWQLNGQWMDGSLLWHPVPGRHELVLLDADGREADRVRFEVR